MWVSDSQIKCAYKEYYQERCPLSVVAKSIRIPPWVLAENWIARGLPFNWKYKRPLGEGEGKSDVFFPLMGEAAYWLGFIQADGSLIGGYRRLQVELSERDMGHLRKLVHFLGLPEDKILFRSRVRSTGTYRHCLISIRNPVLCGKLYELGILEGKSKVDLDIFTSLPEQAKIPFIVGLFDGDGTITFRGRRTRAKLLGGRQLLLAIKGFLEQLYSSALPLYQENGLGVLYLNRLDILQGFSEAYLDQGELTLDRKRHIIETWVDEVGSQAR